MTSSGSQDKAVPGVYDGPDAGPGPLVYALDVDGETFHVRRSRQGGTEYEWVSGPNRDYGFGSSESPDQPKEAHIDSVRRFLRMIDPATGYIAEE